MLCGSQTGDDLRVIAEVLLVHRLLVSGLSYAPIGPPQPVSI